ncbi:MAG: Asp23/Gls24 family envelope stress response protein [Clostridia bacterium]|nr:Asp23/Gls24 family envelope stress response protein [Clostridia bacterium]MBQ5488833.1 Asp23/Gls24 family envelope stress response protein [Clostridia bacterium]MBR4636919.1 Asp23/Gls24 family envelope stress response protein [Clostridia bacterium]
MEATIKNEYGTITLNEDLIASIAGYAACENYGIVAMNSKTAGDTLRQMIGSENVRRGVKVTTLEDNRVDIDLFVTLLYGISFPAVAENAMSNVKYRVEELSGIKVRKVNFYIESIQV